MIVLQSDEQSLIELEEQVASTTLAVEASENDLRQSKKRLLRQKAQRVALQQAQSARSCYVIFAQSEQVELCFRGAVGSVQVHGSSATLNLRTRREELGRAWREALSSVEVEKVEDLGSHKSATVPVDQVPELVRRLDLAIASQDRAAGRRDVGTEGVEWKMKDQGKTHRELFEPLLRESSQRATATLAHLCRELHGAATAVSRTGDQLGDGRIILKLGVSPVTNLGIFTATLGEGRKERRFALTCGVATPCNTGSVTSLKRGQLACFYPGRIFTDDHLPPGDQLFTNEYEGVTARDGFQQRGAPILRCKAVSQSCGMGTAWP
eukprot:g15273.t1